jgi:membrane protein
MKRARFAKSRHKAPVRSYFGVVKQAASAWIDDRAASMGAALAFYSAFSLAPLLIIVIAIAGTVFGLDVARKAVVEQFGALIGPVGAEAVERLLMASSSFGSGVLATSISAVTLLIGATTVLIELQDDLDRIWKAPARHESGLVTLVRGRLLSFGLILCFGFLLLVSLVAATGISALAHGWTLPDARLLYAIDFVISIGVFTILFAMLFKWLPNVTIAWGEVWTGAATTAVLFNLGRLGIGFYLGQSTAASAYAAAGSVLVLLLWLYYSAQVFLFGAELTWAYAHTRAGLPVPKHRRGASEVSAQAGTRSR